MTDYYRNKIVGVTGGCGFVGSHLCEALVQKGAQKVYSLDSLFSGSAGNKCNNVTYIDGNTTQIHDHMPSALDILFHLGEYSRVEQSLDDIEHVIESNVNGTAAVLEFCRKNKIRLIYAGSSTKFGDGGEAVYQSPYAWTKARNTEFVKNYGSWFDLDYAIAYFYNVYGGREIKTGRYATLIALFKRLVMEGQPLTVVHPGTQVRNFTHIDDIVEGLILIGAFGSGDEYGIGSDTAYSILDVAKMFGREIVMLPPRRGNRIEALVKNEKTKALGWIERNSLADHIDEFLKSEIVSE